jgi:hypothetical protein
MTTIRVTFADGHTLDVCTSNTPAELRRMLAQTSFGSWPYLCNQHGWGNLHVEAVRIDYLDPISLSPCINGRIA